MVDVLNRVKMRAPDGSEYWVNNSDVSTAVAEGLRPASDKGTVNVQNVFTKETEEIDVNELAPTLQKGGYRYKGYDEMYDEERAKVIAPETNTAERVGAFMTGLNPLGINDMASGAINNAIDIQQGKTSGTTNEALRALRDQYRGVTTAANITSGIIGGVALGGATTALTAKAATGMGGGWLARAGANAGVMALDSASYTAGMGIGEASLGNAEMNAEKILADTGNAFLFGGALGGLGSAAASGVKKLAKSKVVLPPVLLQELDSTEDAVFKFIDVRNPANNEVIARAKIAINNPESIHIPGKNGVSLEGIERIGEGINMPRIEDSVYNLLVDKYKRILSPSSASSTLSKEANEVLSRVGTKQFTESGADYITASSRVPDKVTLSDKMVELYGWAEKRMARTPDDSEIFAKLTRPENKSFRKKVFEYHENPTSRVLERTEGVEKMAIAAKEVRDAAESLKSQMLRSIDNTYTPKIKSAVTDEIMQADALIYKATHITDEYSPSIIGILKRKSEALADIARMDQGSDMLVALHKQSRDMGAIIASKKKAGGVSHEISVLEDLRRGIDHNIIRNTDVTGDLATNWSRIQTKQAALIKESQKFFKRYTGKVNPGDAKVSSEKIYSILNSKSQLKAVKATADDELFIKSMREFLDEGADIGKKTGIDFDGIRKRDIFEDAFIVDMREQHQAARVLSELAADTSAGVVVDGLVKGAGSSLGVFVAGAMGGLPWYLGAMAGQALTTSFRGHLTNPVKMVNMIEKMGAKLSRTSEGLSSMARRAGTPSHMNALINAEKASIKVARMLGFHESIGKDYTQLHKATMHKLDATTEDVMRADYEDETEYVPDHVEALIKQQRAVIDYVTSNMPPPPRKMKDNRKDALAMENLIESAFAPMVSLERFVITGDPRALQHIKVMYPGLVRELGLKISDNIDPDVTDYRVIDRANNLLGVSLNRNTAKADFRALYNKGEGEEEEGAPQQKPSTGTSRGMKKPLSEDLIGQHQSGMDSLLSRR